jgi:hypothetical protein
MYHWFILEKPSFKVLPNCEYNLIGKAKGKTSIGRLRHRWKDYIKVEIREIRYDDVD